MKIKIDDIPDDGLSVNISEDGKTIEKAAGYPPEGRVGEAISKVFFDKIKMAAVSGGRGCSLRSRACEILLVYEKFAGTGRLHLTCLYHRIKYIARKNFKEGFPWTRKWF